MTEVVFAANETSRSQSNLYRAPIDLMSDEAMDQERHRLVRKTIAAARPVLPESTSRRTKLITAQKIWKEAKTVKHSVVEHYLRGFGIAAKPETFAALRYHPAVLHEPSRRNFPAMLAPVNDLNGEFVGIHRTFLSPDGSGFAPVATGEERRMLGVCYGSYVQLRPASGFRLVITESVEAALTIQQSCPDLPVWASMTLGNMKAMVPASVKEIIFVTEGNSRMPRVAEKIFMDAVREQMNRGLTVLIAQPLPGAELKDLRLG